jgi:hypothetical protein
MRPSPRASDRPEQQGAGSTIHRVTRAPRTASFYRSRANPERRRVLAALSRPLALKIRDGLRSGQRNGARAASYRIESVDINRSACNHRTIVVRRSPTGSKGREVSMGFNKSISIYVRWPLPTA